MERMQENQQQTADQFWNTHFQDLMDTPIDEAYALEVHLWDRLKVAFASQEKRHLTRHHPNPNCYPHSVN